ncbi:hypothetical protein BESB_014900 [Besnoitia besnoiti]|uniref:Transmembrane protein n=1 Tax=Besnoitia besnoiti TaxID=94643 RepID=A0A2A9MB82_BESBE|nr:hypothetical protein BESB_014900 [Besnoitia besnoiti]PFH32877.1 hypothetical protein BESB_014900 [Besnoitia besnoiti]
MAGIRAIRRAGVTLAALCTASLCLALCRATRSDFFGAAEVTPRSTQPAGDTVKGGASSGLKEESPAAPEEDPMSAEVDPDVNRRAPPQYEGGVDPFVEELVAVVRKAHELALARGTFGGRLDPNDLVEAAQLVKRDREEASYSIPPGLYQDPYEDLASIEEEETLPDLDKEEDSDFIY